MKRILFIMLAVLWLLPVGALAAEQGKGVIEGQVVNGTAGGGSGANLDVGLKTALKGAETGISTVKSDGEGRFAFAQLQTTADYSYQVSAIYQKVEYTSEWFTFKEGEPTLNVDVGVYETTTSADSLSIVIAHLVVYFSGDSLLIKEYAQLANMSDRTYVGSKEIPATGKTETLRLSLLTGAKDLKYSIGLSERSVVKSGDILADTAPLYPGGKELSYSYSVPYTPGNYTLSRKLDYPVINFNLLVEDRGVDVSTSMLEAQQTLNITGTQFRHYSGSGLSAGQTIVAKLSGVPQAVAPPQSAPPPGTVTAPAGSNVKWVVLALALLAAGAVVVLLRRRRVQPVATPLESQDRRKENLLRELARLDDQFENKKIPEESYRKLRAEKKAQLVALIQELKGDTGN